MPDFADQVSAALAACLPQDNADLDDDMRAYVQDCACSVLEEAEADGNTSPVEDLKEAVGPILEGCSIAEEEVEALCRQLAGLLAPQGVEEAADDGAAKKDYVVELKDIRLGFGGRMLLSKTSLFMERFHRYGIVGENGIGKTTLLTRIARADIQGWPQHLRCVYVQHEVIAEACSVLEHVRRSNAAAAEADCRACLKDVGFGDQAAEGVVTMDHAVSELSGGWRMKLALAGAMLQKADILMLDEPTNHLDVDAVAWLTGYLLHLTSTTLLFVSHDQTFLSNVATDIVHFDKGKLVNYDGGFEGFRAAQPEAATGGFKAFQAAQALAAAERAASDIPASALPAAEQSPDDLTFNFPAPGPLDGVRSKQKIIMRMEGVSFRYPGGKFEVLKGVSVRLTLASRVAMIGANGAGKTTLLRLLVGELNPTSGYGEVYRHHNLRVSYIAQHSRHHLEANLDQTPLEYISTRFFQGADKEVFYSPALMLTEEEQALMQVKGNPSAIVGRAVKGKTLMYELVRCGRREKDNTWEPLNFLENMQPYVTKLVKRYDEQLKAQESGAAIRPLTRAEIRAHLADFQLDAKLAETKIRGLSGGQKSRLVLAAAMWTKPHILALDEPTNYLDQEALGALARSINSFGGGVIMVSHNREFVKQLASEAWLVRGAQVRCNLKNDAGEVQWDREDEDEEEEGKEDGGEAPKSKHPSRRPHVPKGKKAAGGAGPGPGAEGEGARDVDALVAQRTCTGVLAGPVTQSDLRIIEFSMSVAGAQLIEDTTIELHQGHRYGVVGQNGCGKSNFMFTISKREVPIPQHLDMFHLSEEAPPSDLTGLAAVIDHAKAEAARLQALQEELLTTKGPEDQRLESIQQRLDELDPDTLEVRAAELLHGLGFEAAMMQRATRDMSGGWRMRVSLAQALFAAPAILLLDEPTNHLDLEACVWLENYLQDYTKCLLLISHSQDFLNGVCTNIIHISQKRLTYYTGDFDIFRKTLEENQQIQQRQYEQEQRDIKHLRDFIASCGTYANMMKQAKSKQKILDKMEAAGLAEPVASERTFKFAFPHCDKLPPPVLPFSDVSFAYPSGPRLYECVNLGVDCDSRVALVGPNGAGKSTLLKLMVGQLEPSGGTVGRHPHLSLARFHQHSTEVLDPRLSVLEYFQDAYPNAKSTDEWRGFLGRYGFEGRLQTQTIAHLSEGQKSRLIFAVICMGQPNMLLLDEPTNHLDIDAIDALAEAINQYKGGVVLVSHDFRMIEQVARDIWVCDKGAVTTWKGSIRDYKKSLARKLGF